MRNEEQKDDIEEVEEQNESWWELEGNLGYSDESEGEPDFCWDEDVKKGYDDDDDNTGKVNDREAA